MRRDRAGHAGAVRMRLLRPPDGVVLLDDRAGEVGMIGVDLGVDHRDQHLAAGRDLVHLGELQLLDGVLLGRSGRARGVGRGVLDDAVHVVRRRDADALGFQRAHHVGDLPSRRQAEMIERAAGDAARLHADDGHPEPGRGRVDGLPRHVGADMEHHLGRDEARLAGGRNGGEAGRAGEQARRQPQPRDVDVAAMVDADLAALDRVLRLRDPGRGALVGHGLALCELEVAGLVLAELVLGQLVLAELVLGEVAFAELVLSRACPCPTCPWRQLVLAELVLRELVLAELVFAQLVLGERVFRQLVLADLVLAELVLRRACLSRACRPGLFRTCP